MKTRPAFVAAWVFLAAGCGLRQPYVRPQVPVPVSWSGPCVGPEPRAWSTLKDPVLDRLLREAMDHSPDLDIALARLQGAKALERSARSEALPTFSLDPETDRRKAPRASHPELPEGMAPPDRPQNRFRLPVDVAYEVDLWGRAAFARRSAGHERLAARWDMEAVRLSLRASVASAYLDLCFLKGLQALQVRRAAVLERALAIHQARFRAGSGTSTEVYRQEAELRQLQAERPLLDKESAQTGHRLATLLGRAPGAWADLTPSSGIPIVPEVPAGLPSDLLARRPDLQAAEQRLMAGTARVGEARAAAWPRFSITGDFGFSSGELKDLLKGGATGWGFGPRLHIPLFDGGKNRARKEAADSERARMQGEYRQAVLRAFEEVENALTSQESNRKARDQFQGMLENSRRTWKIRQHEHTAGRASGLTLAEAEAACLAVEFLVLQAERNRAQDLVQLYKAVGGAWPEDRS